MRINRLMAFEALACVFFLSLWLCVVWFDLPSIGHLLGLAAIAFGVSVIRDLVATARLMEKNGLSQWESIHSLT